MENTTYVTFDMDEASQNSFYEGMWFFAALFFSSVFYL